MQPTFRELAVQMNDTDYQEYYHAVMILEQSDNGIIAEGILDKLSSGIKKKLDFIKQIAEISKQSLTDLVNFFKDKKVFKFFKTIGFSFMKFFSIVKQGYQGYIKLQKVIAEYVASQGAVKWTKEQLHKLDAFLQGHPVLKKLGGLVVGGILIYIWLNMSFGGDFVFDMSFDDIILALTGNYSLGDLFAGDEGVRMLLLFATGTLLGLSFPWPGATSVQLVSGMLFSLQKLIRKKI